MARTSNQFKTNYNIIYIDYLALYFHWTLYKGESSLYSYFPLCAFPKGILGIFWYLIFRWKISGLWVSFRINETKGCPLFSKKVNRVLIIFHWALFQRAFWVNLFWWYLFQKAGLVYAIDSEEPGEGGLPQFVKRFEFECDAVLESHRHSIPYYRLQRCVVKEDKTNDSITLTGVPAQ